MKSITVATAALTALGYAALALPASAQADYKPPKMKHQAAPTQPVAGNGQVVVQVIVNTDGTAKFNKIIRSTNGGDNQVAIQIATDSTYYPAIRGGKASKDFYDFTIKFNGKSVAQPAGEGGAAIAAVTNLIRQGKYQDAKTAASNALGDNPGNTRLLQLLGAADYFLKDYPSAAAAFIRVDSFDPQLKPLAAQSLANAAAAEADKNPQQSVSYAQKAVSLDNSTNSKYALGVSQIAAGQTAAGIALLKEVREAIMADPKATTATKVNVDSHLLAAYLAANDTANANAMQTEMAKLDPNGASGSNIAMANHYLQLAGDAQKAQQYDTAAKNYDLAAQAGGPKAAVTAYTGAAFMYYGMKTPDFKTGKSYADKAIAAGPDDAGAMFAEGVGMVALWANSSNKSDADKQAALAELNKADAAAKAAGNEALALNIENFIKNNIKP